MIVRLVLGLLLAATGTTAWSDSTPRGVDVLPPVQDAIVKVYGLGGVAGLEGYQTGFFLRSDEPIVMTVDSPVLDGASVTLIDALGDRSEGRLLGRDSTTGLALIGCPPTTAPPAAIDLSTPARPRRGQSLWVLSNAFAIANGDEPVSVQGGRLAAIAPMPLPGAARLRPAIGAPAGGTTVLLLDAITSNPGAGGGVVVDARGSFAGMLGAECRSPVTGAWINYALPAEAVREAVARIEQSQEDTPTNNRNDTPAMARIALREVGIALIPSLTTRTPAYIEQVASNSPASRAGLRADDLIVAVAGVNVGTTETAATEIAAALQRVDRVELTLLSDQKIVNLIVERAAP